MNTNKAKHTSESDSEVKSQKPNLKSKSGKQETKKLQILYRGRIIQLLADFSSETMEVRREWNIFFKSDERKT